LMLALSSLFVTCPFNDVWQ